MSEETSIGLALAGVVVAWLITTRVTSSTLGQARALCIEAGWWESEQSVAARCRERARSLWLRGGGWGCD